MKFSIVIPAHNSTSLLNCLDSLKFSLKEAYQEDNEIIVVDDGSLRPVQILCEQVKVVRLDENRGPSYARNQGVKLATGDWFIFLDSDVLLPKDHFIKLKKLLKDKPKLKAVTTTYQADHDRGGLFSLYKNIYMNFHLSRFGEEVNFLLGAFCAIKKEVFQDFDEEIRYGEDTELSQRLRSKGVKIGFLTDSPVAHLKQYTPASFITNNFKIPFHFANSFLNSKKREEGYSHASSKQLFSIFLMALCFLSVLVNIKGSLVFLFIFWSINISYYQFITKRAGFFMALKSLIIHPLDCFVMGLGILCGLSWFTLKRAS